MSALLLCISEPVCIIQSIRTHMHYVHYMRRQKTCMCERDVCFRIARHRSFGTRVISVSLWTPNTTLHSALCNVYHEMNKNHLKSSHGRRCWICVRYIYIYICRTVEPYKFRISCARLTFTRSIPTQSLFVSFYVRNCNMCNCISFDMYALIISCHCHFSKSTDNQLECVQRRTEIIA